MKKVTFRRILIFYNSGNGAISEAILKLLLHSFILTIQLLPYQPTRLDPRHIEFACKERIILVLLDIASGCS
ncbi:hypothetical protein ES703_71664 [subsurface metagenome]